jgi:hypothetical protein
VSKLLTTRLQRQLPALIDTNQTGFLQGRCISETFIHALEIIQCSQKRKAPAFVIKLDFAKAFDTVNWCSLQAILRARGFPPQWCAWIHELLSTSKTAILVNECPGPWFPCRRGLRQGDPLSPYLFLLIADVLPRLIQADGGVLHPLMPDAPCPVLQYADDTLIVTKADVGSIERLKRILDSFASATGLKINFGKSSVVPLHTDPRTLAHCLGILGCKQEAFPQNYLGLPLSPDKVRITALLTSIGRADKYLARWKAALLNTMGRAVLADSVLGNLLIYAMCAMELPKGALDRLDAKRRAFLWTGSNKVSGTRCLVTWDHECMPRESGGRGLKNLGVQNQCLLLKLLHRLYHPADSAWARWARRQIDLVTLHGDVDGSHWGSLRRLLPTYRAITTVHIRDGASTSFWEDSWLPDGPLAELLPALYSHVVRAELSVLQDDVEIHLQPRLTRAGAAERGKLDELLSNVALSDGDDIQLSPFVNAKGQLKTARLYRTLMSATSLAPCPFARFVWKNRAPPRVQFFTWLLVQDKIQSRHNLQRKRAIDQADCELCHHDEETVDHIMFGCPTTFAFWERLGVAPATVSSASVLELWNMPLPSLIPQRHRVVFLMLCCWNLWKHRNTAVFDAQHPCLRRLLRACAEDTQLWAHRLPAGDASIPESWCLIFSPM